MRDALARVPQGQQTMAAAAIRRASLQPDREAAHQTFRHVAGRLRPRWPRPAALVEESEHGVLAHMASPAPHRAKLRSTKPPGRLNKELRRRADVVGIFPDEASIARLLGAVLMEQHEGRLPRHRHMQPESMAGVTPAEADAGPARLPPKAA